MVVLLAGSVGLRKRVGMCERVEQGHSEMSSTHEVAVIDTSQLQDSRYLLQK